jgi:hypothetical protein
MHGISKASVMDESMTWLYIKSTSSIRLSIGPSSACRFAHTACKSSPKLSPITVSTVPPSVSTSLGLASCSTGAGYVYVSALVKVVEPMTFTRIWTLPCRGGGLNCGRKTAGNRDR